MIEVKYWGLCPVCGKEIKNEEILSQICEEKKIPLSYSEENEKLKRFLIFFEKSIGKIRKIQKFWAKRIFKGESFASVAPTGIGKSSFGIVMALFLSEEENKKSYLIFPTTILVQQSVEIIEKISQNVKINTDKILFYHTGIKNREEFFEKLRKGEFNVLLTTTQFLSKNFSELKNLTFSFIFVDDVDSVLKGSKNVEKILKLLGFEYFKGKWIGKPEGVLMVSTATAKKGKKANLFRNLLNFDVGSSNFTVRNIEDIYIEGKDEGKIKEILRKMGKGGIIYASGIGECEKWYEILKDEFKIGKVTSKNKEEFIKFKKGEIDYLIGTSYYYGVLTRGIDLPKEVKYAVFINCPLIKIKIEEIENLNSSMIKFIAGLLRKREEIKKFIPLLPTIEKRKEYEELKKEIKRIIKEGRKEDDDFVLKDGEIILPDIRTYIQASGRTSRLLSGGLTKGASFIFEEDREILNIFIKRASYYEIEFKKIEEVNIENLKGKIEESRREKEIYEDLIKPALFVVESPTKAKQIARMFGEPSIKIVNGSIVYEVGTQKYILLITASLGHITDLITNKGFHGVEVNENFIPIYSTIKKCKNCGYQFTEEVDKCIKCGSIEIDNSKERIDALRKIGWETEEIIIGTDPDAEGEKIAWDISNLLSPYGEIKRAEFHEITPKSIRNAFENLREIDENLVKAQIIRRIEDRWIGFSLSQKLWKVFKNTNLSAGRAQSPVLSWIIERAKENKRKKRVGILKEFGLLLEDVKNPFVLIEIEEIEEREEKRIPLPPYTTDQLLQDANRIFNISAEKTMKIAQDLFEYGLITYHRTDSTTVSDMGLKIAKEYLKEDFTPRRFLKEGAHECIRPTRPWDKELLIHLIQGKIFQVEKIEWLHFALYDLIFRRFMASQSAEYMVKIKKYRIKYEDKEIEEERIVEASGKSFQLYPQCQIKNNLPEGKFQKRVLIKYIPEKPLFTQSEIIQMMKTKGIGRPSTYAAIIEKLFLRNYIVEKNGKISPTLDGIKVSQYLNSHYKDFVGEERTMKLQEEMDLVESGKVAYKNLLEKIYDEVRKITEIRTPKI